MTREMQEIAVEPKRYAGKPRGVASSSETASVNIDLERWTAPGGAMDWIAWISPERCVPRIRLSAWS